MERDWAYLEAAALDLILDKLGEKIDHVWFSAVCKNWCSVAKLNNQNKQFRSNVLPMLMITRENRKTKRIKRSLYSIPGKRIYPFQLPMLYNKKFCGFSHGWLATLVTLKYSKKIVITLTHPFKNVTPITLPPCPWFFSGINRVVLSADPLTDPHDYVVVAIDKDCNSLAFIRAGQEFWTCAERTNFRYTDITFCKGLAYAVCSCNRIVCFKYLYDLDDHYGRGKIIANIFYEDNETKIYSGTAYIVKSLEGDLWMVRRFVDRYTNFTDGLCVYKLELDAQNGMVLKILKLENLGDNVLFVGTHSDSTVASYSYSSNSLQKDSIYYSNDYGYETHEDDIMVYNVKEGIFDKHCNLYNPSLKRMTPIIWIRPLFQWD